MKITSSPAIAATLAITILCSACQTTREGAIKPGQKYYAYSGDDLIATLEVPQQATGKYVYSSQLFAGNVSWEPTDKNTEYTLKGGSIVVQRTAAGNVTKEVGRLTADRIVWYGPKKK